MFRPQTIAAGVFAAALILTGCGSNDGAENPQTQAPAPQDPSTSAEAPTPSKPTESATEPAESNSADTASAAANGPEAINGSWCNTPDSLGLPGDCFEVEFPNVTLSNGNTVRIDEHGSPWETTPGVWEYAMIDAPLGTYYPAGVPIEYFDDSLGPDPVDQDRIYNSQTLDLALREN